MKPFSIEDFEAGKPVIARDGSAVSNPHRFPVASPYPILGVIGGTLLSFDSTGKARTPAGKGDPSKDLFLDVVDVKEWVNLYRNDRNTIFAKSFPTQKAADDDEAKSRMIFDRGRMGGRAFMVISEQYAKEEED